MMPERPLDAVFFDFDGVLVDSVEVKTEAFAALYRRYGPDVEAEVVAYHRKHGGVTRNDKITHYQRTLVHEPDDPATVARLADEFGALVKQAVIAAPEIPGARASVEALAEVAPLYIVSATPHDELADIVAARGLTHFFRAIVGAPTTKAEAIGRTIGAEGYRPAHCVMIGDATADLDAARACGVPFIGVRIGGDTDFFSASVPCLTDLVGLAELLLGRSGAR